MILVAAKSAKKPAKKTAAKKPKAPSKASLVKKCNEMGIPIPEGATVSDLQHRLKYWRGGAGHNVRLYRGWGSQYDDHPISMLTDRKTLYWLPDSEMADMILMTKLVVPVKRGEPLNNAHVIDVPEGFDGSNDSADS